MAILNGVDTRTRELVLTEDFEEQKEFGRKVYATPTGQRFLTEFENSDENVQAVLDAAAKLFRGEPITESHFIKALELTMNAGDLTRKPAEPLVEPEVPRDRNGRPLTAAQIKWGEYQRFLAESSSAQIAERRRTDPGFRAFIQHDLRSQMDQPIDGDMRATNPHLVPKAPTQSALANEHLVEFANKYRTMSAADIRKAKRFDTNPLGAKKFNEDEARAIELRLI